MDEYTATPPRRRPRKSKAQLFKEYSLPYLILAVAAGIIIWMIIGALVRG